MRSVVLRPVSSRLRVLHIVSLACFLGLSARAAYLSIWETRGNERGKSQIQGHLQLSPERGLILDRNGIELAVTLRAPSVYVIPKKLEQPQATARTLADILGLDAEKLATRLRERRRFTFIKRWVSPEQASRIQAAALPGVGIVEEPRRAYPAGPLAANLLGFANIDGKGVRAIERQEDEILQGHMRTVPVERDARGNLLVVKRPSPRDTAGDDVRLTIDAALQAKVEAALQNSVKTTGSAGGIAILLDPATGDILSLAEAPSFDPNFFRQVDYADTRSRAFLDALEPGSTLKIFLIAGALEAKLMDANDLVDTGLGSLKMPGKIIRDHDAYGIISVADVLAVSSNVGAVLIGQQLGPQRHHQVLRAFGLGSKTGSGFPMESAGLLRPWQDWKPVDHATISFGQGISVTPIQLAAATAALASGGVWRTPRLVAARRTRNAEWHESPPATERRAVSPGTASAVLRLMEHVVSAEGTGRRAALRQLRVAGKTGTAQKFDAVAGRYSRSKYVAWFIGIVPADDPRLAIVVALDEPEGLAHGGGDVAAPLFAQVAAAGLARLGIITTPEPIPARRPPAAVVRAQLLTGEAEPENESKAASTRRNMDTEKITATPTVAQVSRPRDAAAQTATARNVAPKGWRRSAPGILLPDFRGETLAAALRMAAQDSLVLELVGNENGLAVDQDPSPGTIVLDRQTPVRIRFTLDTGEG
jgi:cell division protein FtsI (penicillin-binding protein 3)